MFPHGGKREIYLHSAELEEKIRQDFLLLR
jgi:hypothetical protein